MLRFIKSLTYAIRGFSNLLITQANFRIHVVLLLFAIVGGFILDISRFEFLTVILASGMVLSAEAFNTAIEVLADKVDGTYDERTRILKDIAASAVLLTAIAALLTGIIVFLPKILHLIFQ